MVVKDGNSIRMTLLDIWKMTQTWTILWPEIVISTWPEVGTQNSPLFSCPIVWELCVLWTTTVLKQEGTMHPHVSSCLGWTTTLLQISESSLLLAENLIQWKTRTDWNGSRVQLVHEELPSRKASGLLTCTMKSARQSWKLTVPYLTDRSSNDSFDNWILNHLE